jgi:hypothetical protein
MWKVNDAENFEINSKDNKFTMVDDNDDNNNKMELREIGRGGIV